MSLDEERRRCLAQSKSPFILDALNSPVKWWTWCREALEVAKSSGKPILLDIGASWCHWCHVMDETTYRDPEVVSLINENFIAIKVDRDERPDIDRRYQEASLIVSGQAGWPLTVFLTPDGEVIYSGTYFPPRDQGNLPGMVTVIKAVLEAYRERRDEVLNYASQIKRVLSVLPKPSEDLDLSSAEMVLVRIVESYDHENGGFGSAPKFPQVTYHSLLLYRGYYEDESFVRIVVRTLRRMGMGGIHDQLGGGFHRYSTDPEWLIPHFEKILVDNAELLVNYSETYALTKDEYLREVGLGIVRFMDDELKNEEGGFYASQDADVDVHDEGGYFRWSIDELRAILTQEEFKVVERYFGLNRFPPTEKAVLHIADTVGGVAKSLGLSEERTREILHTAIEKLREARKMRRKPRVDTTIYTGWSSMGAIAYALAHDYLGSPTLEHSIKTMDFIMSRLHGDEGLRRFYREGEVGGRGLLDDYAYTLNASICAFEHTGDPRYLSFAIKLSEELRRFEAEDGGFYDNPDTEDVGLLSVRVKPIGDTPNWSPSSLAIVGLDRLSRITGNDEYRKMAERALKALYPLALRYGASAASYFIALEWHYLEPPKVVVVGEPDDENFRNLWRIALSTFRPGKLVIPILDPGVGDLIKDETLRYIIGEYRRSREARAYVCAYTACSMPVKDEELSNLINTFMRDKYVVASTS